MSLLCALDALPTLASILFLVTLVALSAALGVGVPLPFVIFFKLDDFLDVHINILFAHMAKCLGRTFEHLRVELDRELDLEEHEKITVFV